MSGPLGADSRVGDYVIEAEIGRGGMGVVYRAHQTRLDRAVALKVIAPNLAHDPTFRGRFDRESRLAASIEHPNAVPVYEAGEADGVVFIAMRLIEGTDLRALLRKESWLEAERAATLIDQVAGALDAAHGRGLVHRDVKPGNVLIGNAGGREWAYLTDFGLTKRLAGATELTESGKWMGTADYASPEQIQGKELDARSDVYSLGCVLYEALTGRIPFEREEPVAKLYAHVNDPPPTVSEVMPEPAPSLDAVIARALAKKPSERFPSAGDLGRAALAASRGDQATVPERSVARGEAAPESQTGMRAALTRPLAGLTTRIGRDAEGASGVGSAGRLTGDPGAARGDRVGGLLGLRGRRGRRGRGDRDDRGRRAPAQRRGRRRFRLGHQRERRDGQPHRHRDRRGRREPDQGRRRALEHPRRRGVGLGRKRGRATPSRASTRRRTGPSRRSRSASAPPASAWARGRSGSPTRTRGPSRASTPTAAG